MQCIYSPSVASLKSMTAQVTQERTRSHRTARETQTPANSPLPRPPMYTNCILLPPSVTTFTDSNGLVGRPVNTTLCGASFRAALSERQAVYRRFYHPPLDLDLSRLHIQRLTNRYALVTTFNNAELRQCSMVHVVAMTCGCRQHVLKRLPIPP